MHRSRHDENKAQKDTKVTELPKIYVKLKDDEDAPGKKVLLPKTVPMLLSVCQRLLQQPNIKCLLDEDGYVVESVSKLTSGCVVYASTVDPEFEPHAPGSTSPRAVVCNEIKPPSTETAEQEQAKKAKEAANVTPKRPGPVILKLPGRQPTPPVRKTPEASKPPLPPSPKTPNFFGLGLSEQRKQKSPSLSSGRSKIDMRKVSRPPSSSESDGEDGQQVDLRSVSTKFTAFMSHVQDSSSDEEDAEIRKKREERRKKIEMTKSCVVLEDDANTSFQQLIEEVVPPNEAPKTLEEALANIRKERVQFIQGCSDLEGEQLLIWTLGAADQLFLKRHPRQPYHDPITQISENFFVKHRFSRGKEAGFRFKGVIVGPRRSGKSTLLGNAVDQYILELAVSGLWKSTFVFVIDMKILCPLFNDYVKFYRTLLDHVLDACKKQRPLIKPYMKNITKQMRSVTEMRNPLIGHHPFHELDLLAARLNAAWRDPTALGPFITGVFMLPVDVPKALGYENVSLFGDNIEYADIDIPPHEPFATEGRGLFAIEHVKYALSQANFIVGCESIQRIYEVMGPIDDEGVDLMSGLDIITLYDTTDDLGSRIKYDYLIEVQEEPIPIRVTVDMCGGIVAYLSAWDELNHTLFQLERTNKTSDKYMELYYEAVSDAQNLVDLLFVCDDGPKVTVSGVRREKKDM